MKRISRETMFMDIAEIVSKRSTCIKKQVGAVLVKDNRIICIGYNGVLPNTIASKGIDSEGITHTVHAEANIISFCAKNGISTNDCTLYITLSPCEKCAELIIQSGIKNILFKEMYRKNTGLKLLKKHGINI